MQLAKCHPARCFTSNRHVDRMRPAAVRKHSDVAAWIEENLGTGPVVQQNSLGSSSWASAYSFTTQNGTKYFVKQSSREDETMFKGEALGLTAMYDTHTLRVPKVFHCGSLPGRGSFIIMEYLDLSERVNQEELGRKLAMMHLAQPTVAEAAEGKFGFLVDNTIGGTPQPNMWMDDWVDFFRERRLRHQLRLAGDAHLSRLGEKVMDNLEVFFEGVKVSPSILHGDLWSGNIGATGGQPCVYDPAVYYGHHEAEFGMSWCAGFSGAFYHAYHELIPRAPGFEERKELYLLYHYLNHYNLFGSGYYGQCKSILDRLTRKL